MPIEQMAPELEQIIDLDAEIRELGSGYGGANGPAEGPCGGTRATTCSSATSTTTAA